VRTDPEKHIEAINTYRDAGHDDVYITQVNPIRMASCASTSGRSFPCSARS
jgi:hypothetical protein